MVLGLLVAMVCVFYTRAQADVKLIVALTGFMQNHCRRANHARDQKAQHDVIGKVHGVVPVMPKVACTRAINVTEQRDRTPLPAAVVCRRIERLLCRARVGRLPVRAANVLCSESFR